jgi:hypothetical protein
MGLFSWFKKRGSSKVSQKSDIYSLSPKSLDLILKYEVGSKAYYEKYLDHPTWPKAASGVTIGIGYDLGYNSEETIRSDWENHLSRRDLNRLIAVCGYRGDVASRHADTVMDIHIPWEAAVAVFEKTTVPKFINYTLKAFPKCEELHPDAFGALVSIVFNRGASMRGSTRAEMRRIRAVVPLKDYKEIAIQIRNMKRLWENKGLKGLLYRRDAEAALVESCI